MWIKLGGWERKEGLPGPHYSLLPYWSSWWAPIARVLSPLSSLRSSLSPPKNYYTNSKVVYVCGLQSPACNIHQKTIWNSYSLWLSQSHLSVFIPKYTYNLASEAQSFSIFYHPIFLLIFLLYTINLPPTFKGGFAARHTLNVYVERL